MLVALAGVACGASGGDEGKAKPDAGMSRADGSAGWLDGAAVRIDAKADAPPANVFADAPVFNWDVPGVGAGGAGGGTGMGGAPGTGGRGGAGGSAMDAMAAIDLAMRPDATAQDSPVRPGDSAAADLAPPPDLTRDAGAAEAGPEVGPADLAPATDLPVGCGARIVPVVPAGLRDDQNLVAGPNITVVLRAEIAGGAAPGIAWSWSGKWNGQPLAPPDLDAVDSALAAFPTKDTGTYSFTAAAGDCVATFTRPARGPEGCRACDYGIDVQVVSPPSYGLASQSGYFPYAQDISLVESHVANFFVGKAGRVIPAYVRINDAAGVLVADGYAAPSVGFVRPLLVLASNGDFARYQVLVVPMDGTGDGTLGATAPQLFPDLVVGELENRALLELSGGITVLGTVTAAGQPANDVRVMLSNQSPAAPEPKKLVFSSVGRSNPQGGYTLAVQPGQYWVSFSPPASAGLPEAIDPLPLALTAGATLDLDWQALATVPLSLSVQDAQGGPAANTRVLVRSTQMAAAGTLTMRNGPTVVTRALNGRVQTEAATDAFGRVTFPAVPADGTYDLVLVPAQPGPMAATTRLSIQPRAGASYAVALAMEQSIVGRLEVGGGQAVDWSKVQVVAFDKSAVVPEPARAVVPGVDGAFSLGVSPGRHYAVVVWPDPSTSLARTFVGPGLLQASRFPIRQKVPNVLAWSSSVVMSNVSPRTGVAGATLQATCHPDYWRCIDPDVPLAETTTGEGGAFTLNVPDPATR